MSSEMRIKDEVEAGFAKRCVSPSTRPILEQSMQPRKELTL